MKTLLRAGAFLAAVGIVGIVGANIAERIRFDRQPTAVGVVVGWRAVYPMNERAIARIAEAGATGVALDLAAAERCDPSWFSRHGLFVVLAIDQEMPLEEDQIRRALDRLGPTVLSVVGGPFHAPRYPPAYARAVGRALRFRVAPLLHERGLLEVCFENTAPCIGPQVQRSRRLLRAFRYDPVTMPDVRSTVRRAVGERSCRLVFVTGSPFDSEQDFHRAVATVAAAVARIGGKYPGKPEPVSGRWIALGSVANAVALLVALGGPLAGCRWALVRVQNGGTAVPIWAGTVLCSVIAGFCATGMLQSDAMIAGAEVPPGIRAALLAPLCLAPFLLYTAPERRRFLEQSVTWNNLFAVAAGALVFGVLLIRSGNEGGFLVPGVERFVRDMLEGAGLVRPRIKEAFVGHPLLLAGLGMLSAHRDDHRGRLLVWFGLVGQVSIVNTFLHVHTPLTVSLLRTVIGAAFGLPLGLLLQRALAGDVLRSDGA